MSENRKKIEQARVRVISVPNGLWVPQRFVAGLDFSVGDGSKPLKVEKGRNKMRDQDHFDPWVDIHMPCSKAEAMTTAFGPQWDKVVAQATLST